VRSRCAVLTSANENREHHVGANLALTVGKCRPPNYRTFDDRGPSPGLRATLFLTTNIKSARHRKVQNVSNPTALARGGFVGAVLTGGYASRMGRDKACLLVAGVPMATQVARAMLEAGAKEVFAVGGDAEILRVLGLRLVPDQVPHEGPLAGIIAALRDASEEVVVVTACDMPWIRERHVAGIVDVIGKFDAVMSAADGQLQPLHTAWKRSALKKLEALFLSGERSALRAIRSLDYSVVDFGAGPWSIDLDTPGDVASVS
jgi:molybdopterin-guanine dinucleotide biosynthesis protein A